jgi:hypothetical protein
MSQSSFRLWIGSLRRCRPPAVTSCSGLPATFTVRPSISRNRPGTSSAILCRGNLVCCRRDRLPHRSGRVLPVPHPIRLGLHRTQSRAISCAHVLTAAKRSSGRPVPSQSSLTSNTTMVRSKPSTPQMSSSKAHESIFHPRLLRWCELLMKSCKARRRARFG